MIALGKVDDALAGGDYADLVAPGITLTSDMSGRGRHTRVRGGLTVTLTAGSSTSQQS